MRKLLIALTMSIAALALTGSASAAGSVRAHALGAIRGFSQGSVGLDYSGWVARADATTIAWGSSEQGASASTVSDGGVVRSLPAQPGCVATAAGSGHIAYNCGAYYEDLAGYVRLSARIVSLTGAVESTVVTEAPLVPGSPPVPAGYFVGFYALDGIGTRWLHYTGPCADTCKGVWSEDVDWRTGEAHKIETVDPSLREDLDARALTVPLCAPLRSDQPPSRVVFDRPWALVASGTQVAETIATTWTLRRCGSSRPVSLPAGSTPVALGGGWAVLENTDEVGPIRLLRLADHRLVTVTGAPGTPVLSSGRLLHAAITSKRVVFTEYSSGTESLAPGQLERAGGERVYTARLPRR